MTPKDRRIILLQKDWTVTELAAELGCRRQELSMTISGKRKYPEIQAKMAEKLGVPVKKLFPDHDSIESAA